MALVPLCISDQLHAAVVGDVALCHCLCVL